MDSSHITLAIAMAHKPVSADRLIELGVARPGELIRWMGMARTQGLLAGGADEATFQLTPAAQAAALAQVSPGDIQTLTTIPGLLPDLLRTGQREAKEGALATAVTILGVLFREISPNRFPGGPRAYVDSLIELVRLYRSSSWQLGGVLHGAIPVAIELGDLSAQAVLLAAAGLSASYGLGPGESDDLLGRAREAAEVVGGSVRTEVLVYTAVQLALSGRLREGITTFEELLGDVPMDFVAHGRLLIDPDVWCVLAVAYSEAGEHPRALELLHRLRTLGGEQGEPGITWQAELFLGLIHVLRREFHEARRFVYEAHERHSGPLADSTLGWFSALALAMVHCNDGNQEAAHTTLLSGIAAWERGGRPPLVLILPYDLAELFREKGTPWPSELDLTQEARRVAAMPMVHAAALGHRWLARNLPEGATPKQMEASAQSFLKAIELLHKAGAAWDMERTCTEAASLHEKMRQPEKAAKLLEAASEVRPACAPHSEDHPARMRSVVLDLGRLPQRASGEGFWGEISARLCKGFGVERCALMDCTSSPVVLAARGGSQPWLNRVVAMTDRVSTHPVILSEDPEWGELVLVPFEAQELHRRGVVALENRHTKPVKGSRDLSLLTALGTQLGVLLGNVTMWQELLRTRERLEQENRYFRESAPAADASTRMVAQGSNMLNLLELVKRVAPSTSTVLITGETGVGKELIAHEVHWQSDRSQGPFIAVHVAAMAPGLVASGLFGHERGAFTGATQQAKGRFELADGGTLFLDEIGELSPEDQVRLLRVLQEGTFERVGGVRQLRSDFRLVAATNRDLAAEVRAGRFREDLYYRLNVFPLHVPPLRERKEEIPVLALYFMEMIARQRGVRFDGIGEADMQRLLAWEWPGNVRELKHVIERASLLSEPPRLKIPALQGWGPPLPVTSPEEQRHTAGTWLTLAESERQYIEKVLMHTGGRVTGEGGAAELLDLKPSTLNFRIRKLGLTERLHMIRRRHRAT